MKFKYSSLDCELLLEFSRSKSLEELSLQMQRDISVVSRRLKKLAEETGLLEKKEGRWVITSAGLSLNQWTIEAMNRQHLISENSKTLKIATTREFSARLLAPKLKDLDFSGMRIEVITSDGDSERLLLENMADVALDCGTPFHPDIRFKKIVPEKMIIASTKKFLNKMNSENYLHFHRHDINLLQSELEIKLNPRVIFNDLGSLRSALLSGLGYSYIPYYVVASDIQKGHLVEHKFKFKHEMHFGIWWQKDRLDIEVREKLIKFMKSLSLQ